MPIVIDPKNEIEDYLRSQGYLEPNSRNSEVDILNAIVEGAARFANKYAGEDFATKGFCWAESVTWTSSVLSASVEAASKIAEEKSCFSPEDAIKSKITEKMGELNERNGS